MRKADNLPPSCAVVMKSGKPNFLEPSGPLQACDRTDLYEVNSFHIVLSILTVAHRSILGYFMKVF